MQRRTKYLFLGLATVWLAILFTSVAPSMLALRMESEAVRHVYQSFVDDLVHGQFQQAYDLTGSDFREQLSLDQFLQKQHLFLDKFGPLLEVKQQGMSISGTGNPVFWKAQFSADFHYEKSIRRCQFAFRKHSGQWVVYGYEELGPVTGQ